jgi:hypothetical protein
MLILMKARLNTKPLRHDGGSVLALNFVCSLAGWLANRKLF